MLFCQLKVNWWWSLPYVLSLWLTLLHFCRLQLSGNYIRLKARSANWYQYSVKYSPNIDSRGKAFKLLYMHGDVIGPARVFDGNILFLPHELPSKVSPYPYLYAGQGIVLHSGNAHLVWISPAVFMVLKSSHNFEQGDLFYTLFLGEACHRLFCF